MDVLVALLAVWLVVVLVVLYSDRRQTSFSSALFSELAVSYVVMQTCG